MCHGVSHGTLILFYNSKRIAVIKKEAAPDISQIPPFQELSCHILMLPYVKKPDVPLKSDFIRFSHFPGKGTQFYKNSGRGTIEQIMIFK